MIRRVDQLLLVTILLASLAGLAVCLLRESGQPGDEPLLQKKLASLRERGIIERVENGRCFVGPAFLGLDSVGQNSALFIAYQAAYETWPPGNPPPMRVIAPDGQAIGTFNPDAGFSP